MHRSALLLASVVFCALLTLQADVHVHAVFVLEALPYQTADLAPLGISNETVSLHYYKHHAGYVSTLNTLLAADPSLDKPLLDLVKQLPAGKAFNQAGQIANHDLYWKCMTPSGGGVLPTSGTLYDALVVQYGSAAQFVKNFTDAATAHFGSGWVFLVVTNDQKLKLVDLQNGDNPLSSHLPDAQRGIPILAFDVWEHAYYVDYRNVRASYITAFTAKLLNWPFVQQQYTLALSLTSSASHAYLPWLAGLGLVGGVAALLTPHAEA